MVSTHDTERCDFLAIMGQQQLGAHWVQAADVETAGAGVATRGHQPSADPRRQTPAQRLLGCTDVLQGHSILAGQFP